MARRRSGIGLRKPRKIGTEERKRNKYMAMAISGQVTDDRWGFRSTKNDKLDHCVFYAKFAAAMFLRLMIGEDEITWLDDNTIQTSSDVTITDARLKKIHSHKITYNEDRYFKLGEEYHKRALIIRSDDWAKPFVPGASLNNRRRRSRKGMFLMKGIAEEVGMTPREARGILRGCMKKPEHGWAWRTLEEVKRIKAILTGKAQPSVSVDFSACKEHCPD